MARIESDEDATRNESRAHSLGGVSKRSSSNELISDDALQVSVV